MRIILIFVLNAGLNLAFGLAVAAVLGPGAYGRFAIGMTIGVVLGTGAFDWLRLSTTRFYGDARREAEPDLRSTLDAAYLVLGTVLAVLLGGMLCFGVSFGLGTALLAAAVFFGIGNGVFEFGTALARARFLDRSYAVLVVVKTLATVALGLGAAWLLKDPAWVLAAAAAGAVLGVLAVHRTMRDRGTQLRLASLARLKTFAAYGIPVVAGNVVLQLVVLMNRSAAAAMFGYVESGRLSLATDLGLRLFLVIGAALDVFLFQLAVRREAEQGHAAAAAQLRRNAVIVVAMLLFLAVCYAAAMPAFEALVVPERYRGTFGTLSLVLLPGLVLFCIGQFAVSPVFQMAARTGPVIAAALVALGADAAGLALLPRSAGVIGVAAVHSTSLVLAAVAILGLALRGTEVLRPDRDLSSVALAAAVTAVAIWPLRGLEPPWLALALQGGLGATVYVATLWVFDVAGLRALLGARFGAPRHRPA